MTFRPDLTRLFLPIVTVLLLTVGPARADINTGWDAFDAGDYATALAEWGVLARKGDSEAQSYLGYLYENGLGVDQDYQESANWYRRAADQGDAFAQGNLGYLYENGLGVPQNYGTAADWYRRAADQGNSYAQNSLGYLYENGLGVPQDYGRAVDLYRRAAKQGEVPSQRNLGYLYENGYGVVQDYAEAAAWYRRAAEQDDAFAQASLGYLYESGFGVAEDRGEAAAWYRRAAEQGDSYAQAGLGRLLYEGRGVTVDLVEAYKWLDLAAEQNEEGAAELRDQVYALMSPGEIEKALDSGSSASQALTRAAQEFLVALGYDVGSIDGMDGPKTRNAVLAYQRDNGLDVTGDVDETLLASLRASLNNRLRVAEESDGHVVLPKLPLAGTGTGFFVSADGHMLTNHHVIEGCDYVTVQQMGQAEIVASDKVDDLAVLKVRTDGDVPTAVFRTGPRVQRGETVIVAGFPLQGTLSSSGNITVGTISALVGFNEDIREYQFSAPIQPGNSGGPLLDTSGHVLGIVSAELAMMAMDVAPQNVNFAIKTQMALVFLDAVGVGYQTAQSTEPLPTTAVAASAEQYTRLVECWAD
jgi:uncharacterized protein